MLQQSRCHWINKTAARELASRGITVNAVAPGFIVSDMTNALSDDLKDQMLEQIPLKRFGEDTDIANTVAFLASDKAKYITGKQFMLTVECICNVRK